MHYRDMVELRKRLLEFYTVEDANKWLYSPHPQLNGHVPVLSTRLEVEAILDRLESGAYL